MSGRVCDLGHKQWVDFFFLIGSLWGIFQAEVSKLRRCSREHRVLKREQLKDNIPKGGWSQIRRTLNDKLRGKYFIW